MWSPVLASSSIIGLLVVCVSFLDAQHADNQEFLQVVATQEAPTIAMDQLRIEVDIGQGAILEDQLRADVQRSQEIQQEPPIGTNVREAQKTELEKQIQTKMTETDQFMMKMQLNQGMKLEDQSLSNAATYRKKELTGQLPTTASQKAQLEHQIQREIKENQGTKFEDSWPSLWTRESLEPGAKPEKSRQRSGLIRSVSDSLLQLKKSFTKGSRSLSSALSRGRSRSRTRPSSRSRSFNGNMEHQGSWREIGGRNPAASLTPTALHGKFIDGRRDQWGFARNPAEKPPAEKPVSTAAPKSEQSSGILRPASSSSSKPKSTSFDASTKNGNSTPKYKNPAASLTPTGKHETFINDRKNSWRASASAPAT